VVFAKNFFLEAKSRFIPGSQQWLPTGHLSLARQTWACGPRPNDRTDLLSLPMPPS
jgi:hypothetical protein